jgi:hypothetical protein
VVSQFWVLYHDRRTQLIPANRWDPAGDNYVFNLDGVENAIIARDVVESVRPVDGSAPEERPEPPAKSGLRQWRITYRDGGTEVIEAHRWDPAGHNYVFNLDGVENAIIARAAVESFMFDNIPEPEEPPVQPKRPFGFGLPS